MCRRIVPEFDDTRMPVQGSLDDAALHAAAAAVDETQPADSPLPAGPHIVLDQGGHVARSKGMQVQFARDGDRDRVVVAHACPTEVAAAA